MEGKAWGLVNCLQLITCGTVQNNKQSEVDGEMLVVFFLLFWQEKSKDQALDTPGFQPLAGHLCRCDRLRGSIPLWRNGIRKTAHLASSKGPVLSSALGAWLRALWADRSLYTERPFKFIPVRNGRGRFDVARVLPQTLPSDPLLLNLLGDRSSPGAGDRSRGLW